VKIKKKIRTFPHFKFFLKKPENLLLSALVTLLDNTGFKNPRYTQYARHSIRCPLKEDNKQRCPADLLFIRTSVTQCLLSCYIVSRRDTNRNNTICMLSVWCHYNTTSVTPCSTEHFLKCILTYSLRLNSLSHSPQENCLYSEWTGWWCLNSPAVQKRFGHSLQTYGFTASCRWTCTLSSCLLLNCFWQMTHVNQVPSLCDFSRCVLSWSRHVKQPEQWLQEYGFASVWIRTWYFSSLWILNSFPQ